MLNRVCYILFPAIFIGSIGCLVHPFIGSVLFMSMVFVGQYLTEPRPERGERR